MSTEVAVRSQVATEKCPWCGSTVSRVKFIDIKNKIAEEEHQKLAEERTLMEQQFSAKMQKAEMRLREEADGKLAEISAERDEAAAKIKELQANEAAVRKEAAAQAEARVKEEASGKLSTLAAERDEATAKLKQLETASKKELEQQRAVLEKDRDAQVLKVQVQNNREREQLQQKIGALTRQVQHKTADELGEGAEIDVFDALRDAFARDDIKRVKRGEPGADIRHQVVYRGESCGTILIDSKNRNSWQNSYVTKLREDQMAEKAEHAVLATTVYPRGKKELYVDKETGVIVVNRARAVEIVRLLREAMTRMSALKLSQTEKANKKEQLYKYIASEVFRQHLVEATRLSNEILDLDVEEKRTHDKTWEKRGKMATRLRNAVGVIDTEVGAIVEGRASSHEGTK